MNLIETLNSSPSIVAVFKSLALSSPDAIVYRQTVLNGGQSNASSDRSWVSRSYSEVLKRIEKIASFLQEKGVNPGDRVAIIANSRNEWLEADLAILWCGGVSVSVYPSLPYREVGYILYDSGAKHVFVENEEQLAKLSTIANEEIPIPGTEDRQPTSAKITFECIIGFEAISSGPTHYTFSGILEAAEGSTSLPEVHLERGSLAALVYTSGTTGPQKGVMQTHGNHLANVRQVVEGKIYEPGAPLMLFLPLSHSFAKLMGYLSFLTGGGLIFPAVTSTTTSKPDPESWLRDLRISGAVIVPIVPRVLEKIKSGVELKAAKRGLSAWLLRQAIRKDAPAWLSPIIRLVRASLKEALFGKKFQYCVSGGAKLPVSINQFFETVGLRVFEGYGLTETCVATHCNRPGHHKIGTVGQPLTRDVEVAIAEDGEVLFRGPNISQGYLNRPTATKASWDPHGWFHTGDLGSVDIEGYLSITGRKKEIIVTAGGKKVAPERIENLLKRSPIFSQVVLLGDGKPYCVALIVLNRQALNDERSAEQQVQTFIDQTNMELASFETIKRFALIDAEFTQENGLLTPTLKIKRHLVSQKYADLIESLYK